jgi:arsenite methyltransferase
MLQRAKLNMEKTGLKNASFESTSGEVLPFSDNEFDVVISNGVFNLIPDKAALLNEVSRVLKPRGRLMLADQVAIGSVQKDMKTRLANWFQ